MDLVFLHGAAASGKLTTARALSDRLGYPVFHNHLVVDLLTAVFPFGSEPFVRLREQMWLSVFAEAATAGQSLLFTFTPEPTVVPGFAQRVADIVQSRGGRVRFVRLVVGDIEQERRIGNASRREFHKVADVDTLRGLRAAGIAIDLPPAQLTIDTDTSTPDQSAQTIIREFGLVPEAAPTRYPQN